MLNAHLFSTLDQVREITEEWMKIYNEYRPHDALGRMPPAAMYMRNLELENSNYQLSTCLGSLQVLQDPISGIKENGYTNLM